MPSPFGIGGPKMKRKVKVSHELCIQHYMRLSLPQFMEGPTILVMNHILNRQMSYKTGVMLCRSTVDGTPLGKKLSTLLMSELKKINNDKTDHLNFKPLSPERCVFLFKMLLQLFMKNFPVTSINCQVVQLLKWVKHHKSHFGIHFLFVVCFFLSNWLVAIQVLLWNIVCLVVMLSLV